MIKSAITLHIEKLIQYFYLILGKLLLFGILGAPIIFSPTMYRGYVPCLLGRDCPKQI